MTYLLAIDPGYARKEPGLGWANFDDAGRPLDFGAILPEDLPDLLDHIEPDVIVYETFRNRPEQVKRHAFTWGENIESQIIGGLKMYAKMKGAKIIGQSPDAKEVGLKWAGAKRPKTHSKTHSIEAYAHGVYYIVTNDIRPVSSFLKHKE